VIFSSTASRSRASWRKSRPKQTTEKIFAALLSQRVFSFKKYKYQPKCLQLTLLTISLMLSPGAPSAVPEAAQVRCSSRLAGTARSRAAHFAAAALGPHPEGPRRLSTCSAPRPNQLVDEWVGFWVLLDQLAPLRNQGCVNDAPNGPF
jgi:hypothetical protein